MGDWFVLECMPGKDFDVTRKLAAAGYAVWRPLMRVTSTVRESGARKRKPQWKPRFGRYLFLEMAGSESMIWSISTTEGVHRFLARAGSDRPAIVPREWMDFLRGASPLPDRRGLIFAPGMRVRVSAGPFMGSVGRVMGVDSCGSVHIEIHAFGRWIEIPLDSGYLDRLEQCAA
ncbi:Transcription+antitermination+protein+RfaH [Methylocapsa aurea]|uniref:transcription termination/antitermination protein NusG n=1 Tax=Methylocapsa aurea TaxID=663610 RepID=UPI003D18D033